MKYEINPVTIFLYIVRLVPVLRYSRYFTLCIVTDESNSVTFDSSERKVVRVVWFGLVYLFMHPVTHVTLDMSITVYNLYITTQLVNKANLVHSFS